MCEQFIQNWKYWHHTKIISCRTALSYSTENITLKRPKPTWIFLDKVKHQACNIK